MKFQLHWNLEGFCQSGQDSSLEVCFTVRGLYEAYLGFWERLPSSNLAPGISVSHCCPTVSLSNRPVTYHRGCMKLTQLPFSLLVRCHLYPFPTDPPGSKISPTKHSSSSCHPAALHHERLAVCVPTKKHTLPCCCSPLPITACVIQNGDIP